MPRRNGGGGAGGAQDVADLRNQVLQLFSRFAGGLGSGGGGGNDVAGTGGGGGARGPQRTRGRAGNRGGGGGGARAPRDGDWACPSCGFTPNFASRSTCFRCGAQAAQRTGSGGAAPPLRAARGPIGAGGSRPMLTTFATRSNSPAEKPPTHRVPGASIAARVAAERAAPHAPRPWGAAAARTAAAGHEVATHAQLTSGSEKIKTGAPQPARRGRWADEEVPVDSLRDEADDSYIDDDMEMDAANEDDDEGDEAWEEDEPSPEELRRIWLRECDAVKALAAQSRHSSSAALAAAREARDRAEENWRRAKKPPPLSVRMGFAQRKLDRAEAALSRVRHELDAFDEDVERRRKEICDRMQEADDRYRARVAQMDDLHEEAASLATGATDQGAGARRTDRSGEICSMVASELQAIAESLDDSTPAHGKINLLLSNLATAANRPPAEQYDIADEGDGVGNDDGSTTWDADASGRWCRVARRGKASGSINGSPHDNRSRGEEPGRSKPVGDGRGASAEAAVAKGTSTAAQGSNAENPTAPAAAPSAPTPPAVARAGIRRREGCQQDDAARSKSHRGHDEEGVQSVEVEGDDYRRALKLREEQAIAAAAAIESQAVFGDEKSRQIAGQLYEHKVGLLCTRAAGLGLAPTSGGRQLIELTPEELAEWMRRVLEPAERAARNSKDDDKDI